MTRRSLSSSAVASWLLLSILALSARTARAEEALSPARQLFIDARKLMADGKYAEACPKFEQSLRLELGIGTQFNLADCWEHIGRTASARALFLGAAASAKAAGQTDREQVLRERAAALEPRISKLVIEVAAAGKGLSIKRDDLPLEDDLWGKAVAIDPGKYTIRARAPGKQDWQEAVEVTAATPVVTVRVPELQPLAPPKPESKPSAGSAQGPTRLSQPAEPARAPAPVRVDSTDGGSGPNYGALTVAGIGLGAVAVGVVKSLQFKDANNEAKSICPTNRDCSIQEIQNHDRLVDEARNARTWSYAGFTVGTVGLVSAAALWYFQRPREKNAQVSWQAAPILAADGSYGAALSGRF